MQKVLRAVREERVRHELRAVRAPVGRVRRGLGDEHGCRGDGVEARSVMLTVLHEYAADLRDAVCVGPVSRMM